MVAFHKSWYDSSKGINYPTLRPYMAFHYRNNMVYNPPELYTNGNWQHLTITREVVKNGSEIDYCYLRYYINATEIYSMGPTGSDFCWYNTFLNGGVLKIGDAITTLGWGGDIAEISIWNRTLNPQEIMDIYINIGLNPDYILFEGLLHYYPLNETADTCTNTQTVQDVWNGHNAMLSTTSDPLCVNQEIVHPVLTDTPSADPTMVPSMDPTVYPTMNPSMDPTQDPTHYPTANPTEYPSSDPTSSPTVSPLTEKEVVQFQDEQVGADSPGALANRSENNGIMDYLLYIVIGVVVILCICLGCLYFGYRWGKSQQQTTLLSTNRNTS